MNPITIYFAQNFVNFKGIAEYFVLGVAEHTGMFQTLFLAFAVLMTKWLFLAFLHQRRIFFKV